MESLLAHCSAFFSQHGNVFAVFFLGGLTGSLTHCLTMCGPMVACQAACGGACGTKLSMASQLHYHLGRFFTYGALGFTAAYISSHLSHFSAWPIISSLMLMAAGVMFLVSGIFSGQHRMFALTPKHAVLRGALMGFMPCGLLYAALMMAATLTGPLSGMVAMWCFVLGTMPALLLASASAAALARKWQKFMHGIGRAGLTCNGLTLLAMAIKTVR